MARYRGTLPVHDYRFHIKALTARQSKCRLPIFDIEGGHEDGFLYVSRIQNCPAAIGSRPTFSAEGRFDAQAIPEDV